MRRIHLFWLSCAVIICTVPALSGCSNWPSHDLFTGRQTHVRTVPPTCLNLISISTPPVQGRDLDVLKAAFKRVRTGTPMLPTKPQLLVEMATNDKVGAPILHVQVEQLVKHDTPGVDAPAANKLLQKAKVGVAAKENKKETAPDSASIKAETVAQELAKRIPWLINGSQDYVVLQSNKPGAEQAATAGLAVIKLMIDKKATLLAANTGERITTFGPDDLATIQPSMQQFASFEPFRLVTLLTARQIMNELKGSQLEETPKLIALVATFNASVFLSAYFDEYLGAGQFVQVSVNQKSLEDDVIQQFESKLKTPLPDEAKKQLRLAVGNVCKNAPDHCTALPKLGSGGFTTLFGQSLQFGGISVAFDSASKTAPWRPSISAPSVGVLGPQLMQVLVEAMFDANGQHPPGLKTSTACAQKLFQVDDADEPQCVEASQADAGWERVNRLGNATQALVTTGVGTLIRGGNIAALNNEAVANTVETFAGVTMRKAVQQVMWACNAPTTVSVDEP
ncbi:hypothetical protein [Pseudomonas moorei]|nr:hypothetical protein [Pseudomonas moorei]KAB0494986.1 hypothetical protein F7R06_28690 [Pseudomonas moorei]